MTPPSSRRYRIVVTISVLFIGLVVLFGLFFRQFIYWQTSQSLIEETKRLFGQINRELSQQYLTTRQTITQTVHMLGATPLVSATTLEERLSFLPIMQAALQQEPRLAGLEVGYASGDFFIVRPLSTDYMRSVFSAPPEADLVVDSIVREPGSKPTLQRFWFTRQLEEIGQSVSETTEYDPRIRPWYIEAINSDREIVTEPYLFHFVRQMGVTVAYMPEAGNAVIAGDVTLYHLSHTLAEHQLTPRSELILLEKKDDAYYVMAYKNPETMVRTDDTGPHRVRAAQLDSPVIEFAATQPDILQAFSSFSFGGETWLGSTRVLELPENKDLYLVMLSPEAELLQEARALQQKTLSYTLAMILLSIPLTYLLARKISKPIQLLAGETQRIGRFDFRQQPMPSSNIKEVDDLGRAMTMMEGTIDQFLTMIRSLSGEQDFDRLLDLVTRETMNASEATAALTYIVDDASRRLEPQILRCSMPSDCGKEILQALPAHTLGDEAPLMQFLTEGRGKSLDERAAAELTPLVDSLKLQKPWIFAQPLLNRQGDAIGLLCLFYSSETGGDPARQQGRLAFIEALSGFAAVTLESRKMLKMQKALLDSFIRLLAGAIDSKSHYTGGHCQRVPALTELIARKACEATEGPFADFTLSDEDWEAIRIASWLHDCGKVTTPEFVVDKSTKLETIYDRIHEIRMRFEVAKREAQVCCWQRIAEGADRETLLVDLEETWNQLDEEFAFVAECNLGGEFLDPEKIERLNTIAARHWMRTLDDRLGISWEERQRKERTPAQPLPVMEPLLADRDDHIVHRGEEDRISPDNDYGFQLDVPEYLYNRGELHNLSVSRGTLTAEERYKINDHIVQSIIMLKQLPYPRHLAEVPDIAGGHHEKMDGSGYPRCLTGDRMPVPARMMAIADIFEALTASDRPYKEPKTVSEAISILGLMEQANHIDPDLFRLFLSSGAYLEYARQYLRPEQIDEVDLGSYLNS